MSNGITVTGGVTINGGVKILAVNYAGMSTASFQNVFAPEYNGSLIGFFFSCFDPDPRHPNGLDIQPGWLCNGPGVTNGVVTEINLTYQTITIAAGNGTGFVSGSFYTFTGV